MIRRHLGLLTGATAALWAGTLFAQDNNTTTAAQPGGAVVVVHGLANNDLLNIRATTSPTGLLVGRVPNGTMMTTTACETVNRYVWCKVTATNDPSVSGWTPQRYLSGDKPTSLPPAAPAAVEKADPADATPLVRATTLPIGILIGHVPSGTMASRTLCGASNTYVWCKVTAASEPVFGRWTPVHHIPGEDTHSAPAMVENAVAKTETGKVHADTASVETVSFYSESDLLPNESAPDLSSPGELRLTFGGKRLPLAAVLQTGGDAREITAFDDEDVSAEIAAAQSAFTVALAAAAEVSTGKVVASVPDAQMPPEDASPVAAAVPVPTPRPETPAEMREAQSTPEAGTAKQLVAAIDPADRAANMPAAAVLEAPAANEPAKTAAATGVPAAASSPAVVPAPASSEAQARVPAATEASAVAASAAAAAEPVETPPQASASAVAMPLPAPAPARTSPLAAVAVTQTGSTSPAPSFDTVGEVPCARYIGQPMTRCEAGVVRTGKDVAQVTVTWPDGGRRIIQFRDGKPEATNARGEFRFTREADLNLIRVGAGERFEIPDELPFGN